jgi:hypothetical protein
VAKVHKGCRATDSLMKKNLGIIINLKYIPVTDENNFEKLSLLTGYWWDSQKERDH